MDQSTQIPLSRQPIGNIVLASIMFVAAGLGIWFALAHHGWVLRIYGARLDADTSRVLAFLIGSLCGVVAVNHIIKLMTLKKIEPFAVTFQDDGLVLPTARFFRGLKETRIPWTDIKNVGVNRSGYTEEVVIETDSQGNVSLPGEFYTKDWKPHRIAEAIRQEQSRR